MRSRWLNTERASIDLRGKNSIAKVLTIGRPICERRFRRKSRSTRDRRLVGLGTKIQNAGNSREGTPGDGTLSIDGRLASNLPEDLA